MICGQVGIAGSSTIGNRVVLAGQVGVADHLKIGNDVVVGGGAGVASNLSDREIYLGMPAIKKKDFVNQILSLRRMETMFKDLMDLKNRFSAIETAEKTVTKPSLAAILVFFGRASVWQRRNDGQR